jgi:hypothetical protein
VFDNAEKSSKLFLEMITLVSSANKIGSDKIFIVGGRSFTNNMKSKSPKIDPYGTPCFTVPHFEENFCNFICFLLSICQIESEPDGYCSLNAIIM